MRKLILVFFIAIFCSGCATNEFARFKGSALRFGVPIYQGEPSKEYHYTSLGNVRGQYKKSFFDDVGFAMSNALENMANNAKAMKANAVIKTKLSISGNLYYYDGDAVVFDIMPKE